MSQIQHHRSPHRSDAARARRFAVISARRRRPETPADLAHHEMLIYNLANDPYSLRLRRGNGDADSAHRTYARQQ